MIFKDLLLNCISRHFGLRFHCRHFDRDHSCQSSEGNPCAKNEWIQHIGVTSLHLRTVHYDCHDRRDILECQTVYQVNRKNVIMTISRTGQQDKAGFVYRRPSRLYTVTS